MNAEQFKENLKHILTEYMMMVYSIPQCEQEIQWCECKKVALGERILSLLLMLDKTTKLHPATTCTYNNPIVYTNFGSGRLLYDYLALSLLNKHGFNYFYAHFIDHNYDTTKNSTNPRLEDTFLHTWNSHHNASLIAYFFPTVSSYIDAYYSAPYNTVLISVDTSDQNILEPQDYLDATAAKLIFSNEKYTITQEITVDFFDPTNMHIHCFADRDDISEFHHSQTARMKEQIGFVLQSLETKQYNQSLQCMIPSNLIVITITAIATTLEKHRQCLLSNEQEESYSCKISWERSPMKDFEELIYTTTNNSSYINVLNLHHMNLITAHAPKKNIQSAL